MIKDILHPKPPKRKPRTVVSADGLIAYRTKCLTFDGASRFANCIDSNTRFEAVAIKRSPRALGAKAYYVSYFASNPARQVTLGEHEQMLREERAALSGPAYQYFRDPVVPNLYFLLSDSGEVYELTWSGASFATCNCPDSTKGIAKRLLIICKHRTHANQNISELVPDNPQPATPATPQPTESTEDRHARLMKERDELWPS
jgi:hypothetical protein